MHHRSHLLVGIDVLGHALPPTPYLRSHLLVGVELAGHAKVAYLEEALVVEEDVVGLEVTVHDEVVVEVVHPL